MTQATPSFDPKTLVDFWRAAGPAKWFAKDDGFDAELRERFLAMHEAAADGRLDDWRDGAESALALVLLLDQLPRNAFRGTARAFATDAPAREVADASIEAGHDVATSAELRAFFYMPAMHSEDLGDQERCVALCEELGDANTLKYARIHRDVIARFGRFPHRNEVLGRQSTDEERAFLESGGFSA